MAVAATSSPLGAVAIAAHCLSLVLRVQGPGDPVAVGCVDPGNRPTDPGAGSRFGCGLPRAVGLSSPVAAPLLPRLSRGMALS